MSWGPKGYLKPPFLLSPLVLPVHKGSHLPNLLKNTTHPRTQDKPNKPRVTQDLLSPSNQHVSLVSASLHQGGWPCDPSFIRPDCTTGSCGTAPVDTYRPSQPRLPRTSADLDAPPPQRLHLLLLQLLRWHLLLRLLQGRMTTRPRGSPICPCPLASLVCAPRLTSRPQH